MAQVKLSVSDLPQVTRALNFIQIQLAELVRNCGTMQQKGLVSNSSILELENKLKKIVHEICAVCRPPPIKPVKDDFDIGKYIARGAFGSVNVVRHKNSQQIFAMKQIKLLSRRHRDFILMERDILIFLDSPFVVSMFCAFETTTHMYMVMEYVGGGNLGDVLYKSRRLSVWRARFYIAEVILALEYIHSHGIIHRDLKPDNLLITNTGHIKVADFGVSKCGSANITCRTKKDCQRVAREFTDNEECGTPDFIAPEVLKHTGYGKPVDWWATGIILFNFLYGAPPLNYPQEDDEDDDNFADDNDSNTFITLEDDVTNYNCAINDDIPWPETRFPMPQDVLSLISRLLDKNCVTRLGTRGAYEVKRHPFFKDVDWSDLLNQKAPFIPVAEPDEEFQTYPPVLSDVTSDDDDDDDYDDDDDDQHESSAEPADFCYVAFRFKEQHSSPLPMSTCRPMHRDLLSEQPEHSKAVEDEDDSVKKGVKYYTMDLFKKDDSGVDSVEYSVKDNSVKKGVKNDTMDLFKEDDSGKKGVKNYTMDLFKEDDSGKKGVKNYTMDLFKEDDSGKKGVKNYTMDLFKGDDSGKNGVKNYTMDLFKEDDSGKKGVKNYTMDLFKEDDSGVDSVEYSVKENSVKKGIKNYTMDLFKDDDSGKKGVKNYTMDLFKEDDSGVDSVEYSVKDNSGKKGVKNYTMDLFNKDDSGVDSVEYSVKDNSVKKGVKNYTMDLFKEDDSGVDSVEYSVKDDSVKKGDKTTPWTCSKRTTLVWTALNTPSRTTPLRKMSKTTPWTYSTRTTLVWTAFNTPSRTTPLRKVSKTIPWTCSKRTTGVDGVEYSVEDDSIKNGVKNDTMDLFKQDDSGKDSVEYSVKDNFVGDNDHCNVDDKTLSKLNRPLILNPVTKSMDLLRSAIKPVLWVTLGVGAALLVYRRL